MAMVNLAKVFETVGMADKTAKSQATRLYNKAGVEVNNGLVSVEDFLTVTAPYLAEGNNSKYAAAMAEVIAKVQKGEIAKEWTEETVTAPKADAFMDAKLFKVVEAYATEKGLKDILAVIEKAKAEIVAKKAVK